MNLVDPVMAVSRFLGARSVSAQFHQIDERPFTSITLKLEGGDLILLATDSLFGTAPIALFTGTSGETEQLQLNWDIQVPVGERLHRAIAEHFVPPGPYIPIWGTSPRQLWTRDKKRGDLAGWQRYFADRERGYAEFEQDFYARTRSILKESLTGKTVLIVGAGSVGSTITVELAQAGVNSFVLVDAENVVTANLSRTIYTTGDVSTPKVKALARHLLNVNPGINLQLHTCSLQDVAPDALQNIFSVVSLVINAADEPFAEAFLNHFAYHHQVPALFVALFAGAKGGEIIFTLPEITPCLECSRGTSVVAALDRPQLDYGSGHLVAEPALGCNIHFTVNAAARVGLSLLTLNDVSTGMERLVMDAAVTGRNTVLLRSESDFLPEVFENLNVTPGQFTFQSVWLSWKASSNDCPICGPPKSRTDPSQMPRTTPDVVELREDRRLG